MSIDEFAAHMAIYELMTNEGYTEEKIELGIKIGSLKYPEHLAEAMTKILIEDAISTIVKHF